MGTQKEINKKETGKERKTQKYLLAHTTLHKKKGDKERVAQ